jgi:transposase-like protein
MSTKKEYVIRKEVKEQIVSRLKNEGIPVAKLAEEHGIHPSTIYNWLGGQSTGAPSTLEMAKLRRENQLLTEIVGRLTLEAQASKKKKAGR